MISLYIHYLTLSHGLYKLISKWAHQGPSGTKNVVKSGAFGGDILGIIVTENFFDHMTYDKNICDQICHMIIWWTYIIRIDFVIFRDISWYCISLLLYHIVFDKCAPRWTVKTLRFSHSSASRSVLNCDAMADHRRIPRQSWTSSDCSETQDAERMFWELEDGKHQEDEI
jgi:hypothetical protein